MNKSILLFLFSVFIAGAHAQTLHTPKPLTHADTLRGSNGLYRQKWNVLHYEITVEPDFQTKTITGKNVMKFFDSGAKMMQVDLQEPLIIDSIINYEVPLKFSREGNVYWVMLRDTAAMYKIKPAENQITIYYHGKPVEAIRPPWDGGWIWKKDKSGNPWMSAACQGLGASVWYPCKDIQSDEPDSGAVLNIIVPDSLMAVGNGRQQPSKKLGNKTQYTWKVINPINNYNIIPYIGKYVHFGETYAGEKGKLDMDYWVLDYNLDKAKKQFLDAPKMMKAFEHWFGPYPFYSDGFKLVESPHLGMEHQSAIAYGNNYQNGFYGKDLSNSGWGMKWDFIVVHESGHEWFANNITTNDIADMWVHEGFTNYSETLFTDYFWGKAAGDAYVQGIRANISNDIPIIGKYGVNKEGSGDMYYKAGNMLHMIRTVINDDAKFRAILRGLNQTFYHQTVNSSDVEKYISDKSSINFSKVFDQYLRTIQIPELQFRQKGTTIECRWANCIEGFDVPVRIETKKGKFTWVKPTTEFKIIKVKGLSLQEIRADKNFYITSKVVQ